MTDSVPAVTPVAGPGGPDAGNSSSENPPRGSQIRPPMEWMQRHQSTAIGSGSDSTLRPSSPSNEGGEKVASHTYRERLGPLGRCEQAVNTRIEQVTWKDFILERLSKARYTAEKHRQAAELAERRQILMVKSVGAAGAEVFEETNAQRRAEHEIEVLLMKLHQYGSASEVKNTNKARASEGFNVGDARGRTNERLPPRGTPRLLDPESHFDERRISITQRPDDFVVKPLSSGNDVRSTRPQAQGRPFQMSYESMGYHSRTPSGSSTSLNDSVSGPSPDVRNISSTRPMHIDPEDRDTTVETQTSAGRFLSTSDYEPYGSSLAGRGWRFVHCRGSPSRSPSPRRSDPSTVRLDAPRPPAELSAPSRKRNRQCLDTADREPSRHVRFAGERQEPRDDDDF
ncbi:hypothetical protein UCRPC4_g04381 [Phaeomoniella chlamydospora]|uniref:Uncharacterized protein n=1 Tax=Phaeomoniella chlamydospora TaxID=158046 RepID=A0A0G2EB99_PHACM|nr:hypothetical protein UCRPC4_g04381 [Phaeomoniella chlamydospora]